MAKTLLRTARFGALAVLEPNSLEPFASRVTVATASDGAPVILVSSLSTHTQGLRTNPKCSLLLGEPGKGDPLAHPRITLQCEAQFLSRENEDGRFARERFLRRHPKAKLYADFGDFSFVSLTPKAASLNGGFGEAFRLTGTELLIQRFLCERFERVETEILEHMNKHHNDAVQEIGNQIGSKQSRRWAMSGVDCEGADLTIGDQTARVWFQKPATEIREVRERLVELTRTARA